MAAAGNLASSRSSLDARQAFWILETPLTPLGPLFPANHGTPKPPEVNPTSGPCKALEVPRKARRGPKTSVAKFSWERKKEPTTARNPEKSRACIARIRPFVVCWIINFREQQYYAILLLDDPYVLRPLDPSGQRVQGFRV